MASGWPGLPLWGNKRGDPPHPGVSMQLPGPGGAGAGVGWRRPGLPHGEGGLGAHLEDGWG